jgi:hypothetical protein
VEPEASAQPISATLPAAPAAPKPQPDNAKPIESIQAPPEMSETTVRSSEIAEPEALTSVPIVHERATRDSEDSQAISSALAQLDDVIASAESDTDTPDFTLGQAALLSSPWMKVIEQMKAEILLAMRAEIQAAKNEILQGFFSS